MLWVMTWLVLLASLAPLASVASLGAGCTPPPVEAHEAAAQLRENPHRIGTVSRQELESDVTDPDSTIGQPARPTPVTSNVSIKIIGMVQSKLCFRVEETEFETAGSEADQKASYKVKLDAARWAVLAVSARSIENKRPWPNPGSTMIKVNDPKASRAIDGVVCVTAPPIQDDTRWLVLAMSWESSKRQLALWELTQ